MYKKALELLFSLFNPLLFLRFRCRRSRGIVKSLLGWRERTKANLNKDVFERWTLTGSGAFFLFICLDAIKFSLQTFFSLLKTIYPRVSTKPLLIDAKSPLPVDVRRSKTLLLKLPNLMWNKVPRLRIQRDGRSLNPLPPDPAFVVLTARHTRALQTITGSPSIGTSCPFGFPFLSFVLFWFVFFFFNLD